MTGSRARDRSGMKTHSVFIRADSPTPRLRGDAPKMKNSVLHHSLQPRMPAAIFRPEGGGLKSASGMLPRSGLETRWRDKNQQARQTASHAERTALH
jgi:hypothetical protein